MAGRKLPPSEFGRVKKSVAEQRGLKVGDEIIDYLLDQIVEDGRVGRDATAREWGRGLVAEFVRQVLDGQMTVATDVEVMSNQRIAQRDHLLALQFNALLHNPKF